MRILNFGLAITFLIFAFLRVNKPDPVIWILVYGAMSVVSVLAIFRFYPRLILMTLMAVFIVYGIIIHDTVKVWWDGGDEVPYRFVGLCTCVIVLLVYLFQSRRNA